MGIVTVLLEMRSPASLRGLTFDDESDGLDVCCDERAPLETIARLVGEAKANHALLDEALAKAKASRAIE